MSDDESNYMQTMESKLQEYRHDEQNPSTALLEAIDNSVDWGKANSITIVKTNSAIFIYDNGHVDDDRTRFSEWLALGKKNNKVYGSDAIGKFGLGLPKGGCLLGDKMSVIALIDGTITTTQCDWERMIRNNIHKPVVRDSTPEEIQEFKDNYDSQGVLVKYENLFEVSKEISIEYIHDIICAQFETDYENSPHIKLIQVFDDGRENNTIQIHDFVDTTCWELTDPPYKMSLRILKVENTTSPSKKKLFVIEEGGKTYYIDKDVKKHELDSADYDEIYSLEVKITAIDDKFHAQGSEKIYKNKQDPELIGAKMYRQHRDITPFTSLNLGNTVSPDNGMYRSKGSRVTIHYNTEHHHKDNKMTLTSQFDSEWNVTSLKNISNEAFSNYRKEGQKDCLKYIGNEASKLYEKKKKDQKEKAQDEVKEKMRIINEEPQSISKDQCQKYIEVFKRLYDEGEYQPDDIDFKEPFKFDGRNGFYKDFTKTGYKNITDKLKLIQENPNKTYEEINAESTHESLEEEEHVNSSINEFTQLEQVNQPSDESTQLEQVNGSSDNLLQLESTNLTSSSDDSSSSSEEDYSTSDESDIETAQVDDSNTEGSNQYSAEKLLTPENIESKNIDNEYLHDSSSAKASIENDIMITKYTKILKENICDRLDFSNPEHRTLIDEFSQKLNQTSYSLEVSNSM